MSRTPELPSDKMVSDFEKSEKKIDPISLSWELLEMIPGEEICTNTGASLVKSGILKLEFLGRDIICDLNEKCFKYDDDHLINDLPSKVVLLNYLQSTPSMLPSEQSSHRTDNPISPFQLPHGDVFFRGAHAIPSSQLEEAFGKDPEAFLNAGKHLAGESLGKGDASFCLKALPCIEIYFYLYAADDEFPARVSVMFSGTINEYLPLDSIWALTNVIIKQLLEFKNRPAS